MSPAELAEAEAESVLEEKTEKKRKRVSKETPKTVIDDKGYVLGRFTPEEDQLVRDSVSNFIEANQLGNQGLDRVLNCKNDPEVRTPWKDIAASLPWRNPRAVYRRAHILFKRSENRKWEPHEYETLLRLHKVYGSNWKLIGKELGKYEVHVLEMFRRVSRLSGVNHGRWSLEEYQKLFNLVNLDLVTGAFEGKSRRHALIKDNISWEAIADKLSTRLFTDCCKIWYNRLSSSLVREGLWLDTDDYIMMDQLQKSDACCVEDVDWDNLLAHRPGDICRKRWDQMVRHIGGHKERSFIEQVDVLAGRYCTEMLEYRKDVGGSDAMPSSSGSSIPKQTKTRHEGSSDAMPSSSGSSIPKQTKTRQVTKTRQDKQTTNKDKTSNKDKTRQDKQTTNKD